MQCWRGNRQQPERDGPRRGHLQTRRGGRGRSTLCAPHAGPSSPRCPPHGEPVWLGVWLPRVGEPPRERAWPSGEGAMEPPPSPLASHGDAPLRPTTTVATREGGGRKDCLRQPPSHRPPAACEALCAPPCACRQGGARRATSERGRCHARPRRAMARPPLRLEAWRCWTARSYCPHTGAVPTVKGEPRGRRAPSITALQSGSLMPRTGWGRPRRGPSASRAGSSSA
jgi:hypothetical protein